MKDRFPDEPVGAEAALYWHTERREYHAWQEAEADTLGHDETAVYSGMMRRRHAQRLGELRALFPETAKVVREQWMVTCSERARAARQRTLALTDRPYAKIS